MSQYIRHWLEDPAAAAAPGVARLFGGSGSFITSVGATRWLGEQGVSQSAQMSTNQRQGLGLVVVNADAERADVEILQTFDGPTLSSLGTSNAAVSVGARVSGTEAAWNGYFADILLYADQVAIKRGAAGVDTVIASAAKTGVMAQFKHMRFVCRTLPGSPTTVSLKLRVWFDDAPEPSTWDIDTTDSGASAIYAAGTVMLAGLRRTTSTGSAGSLGYRVWYMSVGTGNSSAPTRPKTYVEWVEFLYNQDALRAVLSEVSVVATEGFAPPLAVPGKLVFSNIDFQSKPEDFYPNVVYEELITESPRVRRRLHEALGGLAVISYGDVLFKSEVNPDSLRGALDDWLTYNFDGQLYTQLIGHPSWRRVDFKIEFRGTVQRIYRAGYGMLGFSLRGLDAAFQLPMHSELIGGSGPNANAICPFSLTGFFNVKPPVYDSFVPSYQLGLPGRNNLDGQPMNGLDVRDSGGSLNLPRRTISAVNTGTDVLTSDAAHLLQVGATWRHDDTGSLPGGLDFRKYYVRTVPTSTTFTLSLTPPGASPTPGTVDITSSVLGAGFIGRLYDWDADTGLISLLNTPAGQITVNEVDVVDAVFSIYNAVQLGVLGLAGVFNAGFPISKNGGSAVYGNLTPFNAATIFTWWDRQITVGAALQNVLSSISGSFCITREGFWYLFQLDVPTGVTTKPEVLADDIYNWREGERFNPSHVERLGYYPNPTIQEGGDLLTSVTVANRDLYGRPYTLAGYTPPASTSFDQPSYHVFAEHPPERGTRLILQTDAEAEIARLYNLYSKMTGTFIFETDAWAISLELGDEIRINYPKDGFHEGKNAIVVGLTEIATKNWVEVEVFCQIPGLFPEASSSNPFVSEDFY